MATLNAHGLQMDPRASFNPEWKPGGFEGAVDTNKLPWIPLPQIPGCSMKPLRVSNETGAFTVLLKLLKGTRQPDLVHLGPSDTFVLSGRLKYAQGPIKGSIGAGVWSYAPAGTKMEGTFAEEDTECLASFYGPVAFLEPGTSKIQDILTGFDVKVAAKKRDITLLPNTLAEAMQPKPTSYSGLAEPLKLCTAGLTQSAETVAAITKLQNPHFVDTKQLPWI